MHDHMTLWTASHTLTVVYFSHITTRSAFAAGSTCTRTFALSSQHIRCFCQSVSVSLNIHCTFWLTGHSQYIRFTIIFTAYLQLLHVRFKFTFTAHSLYICFTCTAYSLYIRFKFAFTAHWHIRCCECCFNSNGLVSNRINPVKVLLHVAMSDSSDNLSGYKFV